MRLSLVALLLPALVGCGSSDSRSTAPAESPESPSASATTSSPPKISERTACHLLFGGKETLLSRSVRWVAGDDAISVEQAGRIQDDVDEMVQIAAQAPDSLAPHLTKFSEIMQEHLDDALGGEVEGEWDTTELKASGSEIALLCSDY